MRRLILVLLAMWGALLSGAPPSGATSTPPDPAIAQAMAGALRRHAPHASWAIAGIRQHGDWAIGFVAWRDPDTGHLLPGEPGVALARRGAEGWAVALPNAPHYAAWLEATPVELLPPDVKAYLRPQDQAPANVVGYRLPWPNGQQGWAAQHTYPAVDLDVLGWPTLGTVRAAKSGQVMFRNDESTVACGYPPASGCPWQAANIIVIRSASNEYVWYMHLTPHSIPTWIQVGTWVERGTDIGVEGETGWATAPHIHFQVATNYSCCSCSNGACAPNWPTTTVAVDFDEYPWSQVNQRWLVSQNTPPVALDHWLFMPLLLR